MRDTELKRIPLMLIVGEKEAEQKAVAVRVQGEGDKGQMPVDEFIAYFKVCCKQCRSAP
ncbi:MAG: His/Gly/Thr/Pro-type tRNA ligase C-terminal domain-containing protein [Saprospiraceae bacterium]